MALAVVNDSELQALLGQGKPVVADFSADWCAPCRAIAPELEALSARLGDDVAFVKIDTDAHPQLTIDLGIRSVPTLVHFGADGAEVARTTGAAPAAVLAQRLRLDS
jgi:thioredoxin